MLIHVAASSLNPLEYKPADLNFMGRTPPVALGFDLAGVVAGVGRDVEGVTVGSEQGFAETAKTVRRGGNWIVLGVGPGRTTRLAETHSPVDAILTGRGARHGNIDLLRYFAEPPTLDGEARDLLQRGMDLAMEWAAKGFVVPHVSQTVDGTVEAINTGLRSLKEGGGALGKIAVIVDRDLAASRSLQVWRNDFTSRAVS
ncbi:hypothetical protein [Nonomuraea sp. NPDC050643]|uniref:alcohol dehydrogenase catalytic domain-containing protein n=1 Tax=Nonomuraea sp. NPDC050643 TaxID=3155660 RepID=UPI0033CEC251